MNMTLQRVAITSLEHFQKLGGADRYEGYRNWHSFALVVLLATNCSPKNNYKKNELLEQFLIGKGLNDMFELRGQHVNEIAKMLEVTEYRMSEIHEYETIISDLFEYDLMTKRPVSEGRKYESIQNLKEWTVFCWLMRRVY